MIIRVPVAAGNGRAALEGKFAKTIIILEHTSKFGLQEDVDNAAMALADMITRYCSGGVTTKLINNLEEARDFAKNMRTAEASAIYEKWAKVTESFEVKE